MLATLDGRTKVIFGPRAQGMGGIKYRGFSIDTILPTGANISNLKTRRPTTWEIMQFQFNRTVLTIILFIVEWYFGIPPPVRFVLNKAVFWVADQIHKWRNRSNPSNDYQVVRSLAQVQEDRAQAAMFPSKTSQQPDLGNDYSSSAPPSQPSNAPNGMDGGDSPQLPESPELLPHIPQQLSTLDHIKGQFSFQDSPNVFSVLSAYFRRASDMVGSHVGVLRSSFENRSKLANMRPPHAVRPSSKNVVHQLVEMGAQLLHAISQATPETVLNILPNLLNSIRNFSLFGGGPPTDQINLEEVMAPVATLSKLPRHIASSVSLEVDIDLRMPQKPVRLTLASGAIVEPSKEAIMDYKSKKKAFYKRMRQLEVAALDKLLAESTDLIIAASLTRGVHQLTIFERTGMLQDHMDKLQDVIQKRVLDLHTDTWSSFKVRSWKQTCPEEDVYFIVTPSTYAVQWNDLSGSSSAYSSASSTHSGHKLKSKPTQFLVTIVDGSKTNMGAASDLVVSRALTGILSARAEPRLTHDKIARGASREMRKILVGSVARPDVFVFRPSAQLSTLGYPSSCLDRAHICTTMPQKASPTYVDMLVHALQSYAKS